MIQYYHMISYLSCVYLFNCYFCFFKLKKLIFLSLILNPCDKPVPFIIFLIISIFED
jgi:hypothetical protein